MRFHPRSLFSRLVLVLMSGLVVAQILSLAIHAHERGRLISEATGVQSAQRIADIVKVLEPLAPDARRKMVSILSAPPLTISLTGAPPARVETDAQSRARGAFFEAMLRRYLGPGRQLSVTVTEAPPLQRGRKMGGFEGRGMHHAWMGSGPQLRYGAHPEVSFVARVTLADGTEVEFDSRQPQETLSWPYRMLGSVAILLLAVIALSLVAVRWATRPLKTLAEAADQLGRDIHRPPIAETGPVEVERAARAFNAMQAKLVGYLDERTRMLAAMSHDLKTPITRLKLRAEMLPDGELRSKFGRDLEEMETMVGRTLDFMRGVKNEEPIRALDVNALVESLQSDMREIGHEVELEGAARAPYAARPQALKRCLANLLDNAVRYGQSARVTIDDRDDALRIRIVDRGPGIPDAALDRVFEPFVRLEESRSRETGGTGLGLSIARSIAEAHGGTLTLANRPEGGLEATLSLPRRANA